MSTSSSEMRVGPENAAAPGALPASIRQRFPIFEQRVYINSCSQGALSDAVRASYDKYLADWDEHGAPWEYWVERGETARAAFAGLVSASPAGESPRTAQIGHAREGGGPRVPQGRAAPEGTTPVGHFDRATDDDTL